MNNPTLQRALPFGVLGLSGLTLLISVLAIFGIWYANFLASSLVTDVTVAVEKTAQGLERSVTRVDTQVGSLRDQVNAVQQAVTQISQNVADEGLLRRLLPDTVVERLDNAIARVTETTEAVRDSFAALMDMYRAMSRIPFVTLPAPSDEAVQQFTGTVGQIRQDVADLRAVVSSVRARQAGAIERVNGITTRVDTRLGMVQDTLNQIRARLTNIQDTAKQVRATVRNLLTIISILLTLFLAWVIVTQVLVMRPIWERVQATRHPPAPPPTLADENGRGDAVDVPPASESTPT